MFIIINIYNQPEFFHIPEKKQEKSQKPVVFYVVIWSIRIIIPRRGGFRIIKI